MEIKNLCFSYNNKNNDNKKEFMKALCGTIEKGKITTILGPNGSGKSTLLNLLVKQLKPQSGEVILDGKDMSQMSVKEIAKKIAMVHQANSAPSDLSIERLVGFGRMPHQTIFSSQDEEAEETIAWALKVTKLEHMAHKSVGQLSGGERQRAWIAMALAQKTEILFLDEPTTYLDVYYQLEVLNLVRHLNREYGMTIVMVLHDINQAMQFSDNLIIMNKGSICYKGSVREGITEKRLKEVYGIKAKLMWSQENQCPFMIPIVADEAETEMEIEAEKNKVVPVA